MKTLALLVALTVPSFACPPGTTEWAVNCSVDIKPYQAPSVQPSDEKPEKHPQAAWERGEVNVVPVPEMTAQDMKDDAERLDAIAIGKTAAGISN